MYELLASNLTKNRIRMDPRKYLKPLKVFVIIVGNILLLPIALILFIIRILFRIKFVRLMSDRIGHLAENTDLLLRKVRLGVVSYKVKHVGIASTKPCNTQLLKMFKRVMPIIQIPQFIHGNIFFRSWSDNPFSVLNYSDLFQRLTLSPNEYYEFNNTPPTLKFTKLEEKKGKALLKKMGVNSWFICFHARDRSYLFKKFKIEGKNHYNYTDCSVNNYLKAAEYITKKGGFALRLGEVVGKKIPELKNSKIIDYATKYRADFGDIYFLAKCKFFLGNCSGIYLVPTIFHVPVAMANFPCWGAGPPLREGDLFIPKKIWSIRKKRFLTFKEIFSNDFSTFFKEDDYTKAGLKLIENSPEEILDLAIEMNERIDGTWKTTNEDERLQEKFYSIYRKTNDKNMERSIYNYPSRIGTMFLRKNRELIG